ncbi:MAG: circadian clock KaiB family protein [Leptospiraceae bacterium]|nr:circadian clock KaiB family protein [Leptospiraceae bacterium]
MEKFIFYLYVTAGSKSSEQAILDVKNFCEGEIGFNYEIFIIDILQEPYLAEESQILATPTLIKVNLDKEIRLIGNFSDKNKLMQALELEKVYG